MSSAVEFSYVSHVLTVPVHVAGVEATFGFDTGIGLTLVSPALADRVGVTTTSSSTAQMVFASG